MAKGRFVRRRPSTLCAEAAFACSGMLQPQTRSYLRRLMSAMPAAHTAMPAIPSTAANAAPLGSPVLARASDELEAPPCWRSRSLCRPCSFRRTGSCCPSRPRFPGRGRRESRGRSDLPDRVSRAPPGPDFPCQDRLVRAPAALLRNDTTHCCRVRQRVRVFHPSAIR